MASWECVITAPQRGWLRQEEFGVDEHRGEEHVFNHTGLGICPGGSTQLGVPDHVCVPLNVILLFPQIGRIILEPT